MMKNSAFTFNSLLVLVILLALNINLSAQDGRRHSITRSGNIGRPSSIRPTRPVANNTIIRPNGNNTRPNNANVRPSDNARPLPVYGYNNNRPRNNYRPVGYRPHYGYNHPYSYYGRIRYPFMHYGPSFGFRIHILPFGFFPFYLGGYPYYYYQGIYYRPYQDGGYEVIAPPLGARVSGLPPGARPRIIDGEKYYELGGTFYQEEITEDNRLWYVVVGIDGILNTNNTTQPAPEVLPPAPNSNHPVPVPDYSNNLPIAAPGTKINELPAGSKAVVINQQKFYEAPDGIYYQEVIEGDSVSYVVVGNATEQ